MLLCRAVTSEGSPNALDTLSSVVRDPENLVLSSTAIDSVQRHEGFDLQHEHWQIVRRGGTTAQAGMNGCLRTTLATDRYAPWYVPLHTTRPVNTEDSWFAPDEHRTLTIDAAGAGFQFERSGCRGKGTVPPQACGNPLGVAVVSGVVGDSGMSAGPVFPFVSDSLFNSPSFWRFISTESDSRFFSSRGAADA